MKITGVKIEKLLLELTSPFRVAFGTITHSENVMIKVTTDEGVTGYGEAAPLAFVTAETTDSVLAALELFRTGLIGMDPLDIEAVHAMMDGLMGGNSSAKCAVDLAMYDIRGKAAGMPVSPTRAFPLIKAQCRISASFPMIVGPLIHAVDATLADLAIQIFSPAFSYSSSGRVFPKFTINSPIFGRTSQG